MSAKRGLKRKPVSTWALQLTLVASLAAAAAAACSDSEKASGSNDDAGAGGALSEVGGAGHAQGGASNNARGGDSASAGQASEATAGAAGDSAGGSGARASSGGAGGDGGAAGASAGAGGAGDELEVNDAFGTSANGWTITGDAQASSFAPDYSGVGGNPDGMISAVDDVAGGVWYFTAPAKYLGNNSRFYGKSLRFDLQTTAITTAFVSPDVELTGAGLSVVFDCSPDPGTSWTSYDVPLTEAGWTVTSLGGVAVTAEQFQQVLAATTQLRIRGEYNTGPDTGRLDNVSFGAD